jgi:hypothetical protein
VALEAQAAQIARQAQALLTPVVVVVLVTQVAQAQAEPVAVEPVAQLRARMAQQTRVVVVVAHIPITRQVKVVPG